MKMFFQNAKAFRMVKWSLRRGHTLLVLMGIWKNMLLFHSCLSEKI